MQYIQLIVYCIIFFNKRYYKLQYIFGILQMIIQNMRLMTDTIIGSGVIIPWAKILKMKDITCNEDWRNQILAKNIEYGRYHMQWRNQIPAKNTEDERYQMQWRNQILAKNGTKFSGFQRIFHQPGLHLVIYDQGKTKIWNNIWSGQN